MKFWLILLVLCTVGCNQDKARLDQLLTNSNLGSITLVNDWLPQTNTLVGGDAAKIRNDLMASNRVANWGSGRHDGFLRLVFDPRYKTGLDYLGDRKFSFGRYDFEIKTTNAATAFFERRGTNN